jgi:thiol:disulfide interchange protein DsbD
MDPGWHTYWRNPGDAGLPTKAKWTLPEGFIAGELQWPRPGRFNTGPLVSFGYEGEVLLPVEIQVPAAVASSELTLSAKVSWLECEEICLPGKADLALTLPVRNAASPGPAAALFRSARAKLPQSADGWRFAAASGAASIDLTLSAPKGATLEEAYFYPFTRKVLDYSTPQSLTLDRGRSVLALPRDARGKAAERLQGVLVGRSAAGPFAVDLDVPVKTKTP